MLPQQRPATLIRCLGVVFVSEVTEGGTQHEDEKSCFLVCMRGRAGYIHEYAKDLGMNDDEAVYPSFYLRHFVCALLPRIILKFLLETRDVVIKNNLFPVSLFLLERPLWLVVKLDIGFLY